MTVVMLTCKGKAVEDRHMLGSFVEDIDKYNNLAFLELH